MVGSTVVFYWILVLFCCAATDDDVSRPARRVRGVTPSVPVLVPSDLDSSSRAAPDDVVVTKEDTSFGPFTGPHAIVLQVLMEQFFGNLKNVMPLLLQEGETLDVLLGLEGSLASLRAFDVVIADRLHQFIAK